MISNVCINISRQSSHCKIIMHHNIVPYKMFISFTKVYFTSNKISHMPHAPTFFMVSRAAFFIDASRSFLQIIWHSSLQNQKCIEIITQKNNEFSAFFKGLRIKIYLLYCIFPSNEGSIMADSQEEYFINYQSKSTKLKNLNSSLESRKNIIILNHHNICLHSRVHLS